MANILNVGPIVPVNKGTYSSTTTYSILNLVDDGTGQVYLSKKNNNLGNNLTNEEWWGRYTGKSAYEVAVANGYEGTEAQWLDNLKGEPGTVNLTGEYGTSESVGLHQKFLTEKMTELEEKTEDFTMQVYEEDSVDAEVTILPGAYYDDGSYNPDRADRACCVIDGEVADRVGIFTKDDVLIKYIIEVRNGSSRSRIPASGSLDIGEYHIPVPGATVYYVNFSIASGGTAPVDYFAERIEVLKGGLVTTTLRFRQGLIDVDRADSRYANAITAATSYKNDHADIWNDSTVQFEDDLAINTWPKYLIEERNNYLQVDYDASGTTRSGVTVKSDGKGKIVLVGTATDNNTVNYKNNWTIPEELRGERSIIYAMAQRDASYFIRFRDANGEQVSTSSFTSQADTLLARSVSIPSTATSVTITISNAIVSGVTYNGTVYWMGLYSDGRNAREHSNGDSLIGVEKVSGLYRRISLSYQRDTKEYIDERSAGGYITPEQFGAAGDGVTDDTVPLQACINDAVATGKSVGGYGKYKTSAPIKIIGNHLNININAIYSSVSGNPAIVTIGSYNTIAVKELTSDDIGLLVTQIKTGEETRHCRFDIENITAVRHCIEVCTVYGQGVDAPLVMFGNTYNVQIMESEQGHGVYTHNLYDDSSYYIGMIKTHNNWAINCGSGVMRLYNTELEHAWAGFLVNGSLFATNVHLMEISEDARPGSGYEGWQAKLVGATSRLQFTSVSDVDVFPDLIENARDFTGVDLRDSKTNFAYCYTLGWCSSYIPFLYDTSKGYSFMQPSKVVIYGTRKAIVPSYKADLSITSSLFDNNGQLRMDDHNTVLPYKFVIDGLPNASNTLYLGESYVPVGIDEFEVVIKPTVTGELIFKDTFNRIVFDTSDKAAGTYRVKAIAPSVPTNTPAGGKLWGFLEDNFTWEVERIVDETTIDDEPTAGSNNLVKSGGVQNALVNIGYYKGSLKRAVNVPFIVKNGDKIKITFTASEGVGISLKNASGGNVTTILVPSGESSVDTEYTAEDNIYYVCGSQGNVPNITMQSDRYDAKTAIDTISIAATLSDSGIMTPKYFASLVKSEYGDIKESGLIKDKTINGSGGWSSYRSILVPVSLLVGCKINVSYPSNATNPKISFLKTYDTSQAPDFCSGYSGRVDARTYIIPSDCNYVLCNCGASGGSVDPDSIRIMTNQDRLNGVESKLYNTFENNIDLSEETVYNTMIRSTGYWYGGGAGACLLIDIEKFVGDNITITYPEGSTNNHTAFLDTDSHVNNTLPDYNGAYNTDDKYISSGKYIIPNGCRYLYVELRAHSQSGAELTYPTVAISSDGMVNELAALRIAEQTKDLNNSKYYDINVDRLSYSDNMLDAPAYVYDDSVYSDRLEQFYALYDELATSYPNYITKYNLDELSGITNESYDSELYPIYMYRFNMLNSSSYKRPIRIMLISGTHIEYAAMFSVYNVMKNICEKWNQYEGLAQLRLNVEFIVIPCSSPWQIANNEVRNINDVNLNRNCGTLNWERDDSLHTGVSADSEYETKVFEWALLEYKPHAVFDLHNYTISDYTLDGRFTMPFCADAEILSMLIAMARDEELRFKKDFSGDAPSVDTPMTGSNRYTETGTPGRRMLWAYDHGFKVSANIEMRPAQIWHNGEINTGQAVYGEADCIKIGVDVYTNTLFYTIKKITELKL